MTSKNVNKIWKKRKMKMNLLLNMPKKNQKKYIGV